MKKLRIHKFVLPISKLINWVLENKFFLLRTHFVLKVDMYSKKTKIFLILFFLFTFLIKPLEWPAKS